MTASGKNEATPVRVVGSWRSSFWGAMYQAVLVFTGVVLALAVAPWAPTFNTFLTNWRFVEPSCEDPRSLQRLDVKAKADVFVSSVQDSEVWPVKAMFDGRPGSGWVPATQSLRSDAEPISKEKWPSDGGATIDHPRIVVKFHSPERVRLLCIINGNGADLPSYTNADRVRTAKVVLRKGDDSESRLAPLRTLPEYEIQNRQKLWVQALGPGLDDFQEVEVEIVERYSGSLAFDPERQGKNKWSPPTRNVMVGELEIYVDGQSR